MRRSTRGHSLIWLKNCKVPVTKLCPVSGQSVPNQVLRKIRQEIMLKVQNFPVRMPLEKLVMSFLPGPQILRFGFPLSASPSPPNLGAPAKAVEPLRLFFSVLRFVIFKKPLDA
jgi:hypothetical protein